MGRWRGRLCSCRNDVGMGITRIGRELHGALARAANPQITIRIACQAPANTRAARGQLGACHTPTMDDQHPPFEFFHSSSRLRRPLAPSPPVSPARPRVPRRLPLVGFSQEDFLGVSVALLPEACSRWGRSVSAPGADAPLAGWHARGWWGVMCALLSHPAACLWS